MAPANYQRSHCGHGLGIGAHEFPTLNPANREDIIVIRKDGNECLTDLPRELWRV